LCKSGIPISTSQGAKGGIAITDGYHIDKTLCTENDMKSIFTGLMSLNSVAQDNTYQNLIDKFFPDRVASDSHIIINLASYYKDTLAPKIAELLNAIKDHRVIEFVYCNANGERRVALDPYLITFQWSSWYVLGFDHFTREFRLFKLNRLRSLQTTIQSFSVQDIPGEQLDFDRWLTDYISILAIFDADVKYRLIEEYGTDFYTELPDGRLRFEFQFTNEEYILSWLLGFGEKVELIEPKELREKLKIRLEKSIKKYLE
jgi:predicted DNA-binding transcriptional regulator YafY